MFRSREPWKVANGGVMCVPGSPFGCLHGRGRAGGREVRCAGATVPIRLLRA